LFEFKLHEVESIEPWGDPIAPSLSWFGLSLGDFWIAVGQCELFRYTEDILAYWQESRPYPDYQIAAYARGVLSAAGPAMVAIPPELETVATDWFRFCEFYRRVNDDTEFSDTHYAAFRWIGERRIDAGWLVQYPSIQFFRVQDRIVMCYDNREKMIEKIPVWRESIGSVSIQIDDFHTAVEGFVAALLKAMDARIDAIEAGLAKPRCAVDTNSLRHQHQMFVEEFRGTMEQPSQDVSWEDTIAAVRALGYDDIRRL
jgi:hypothetical protein